MKPKDYIKAMTTGRWPPKKEDDMPISPGTERAIMRLSETLPALVKSVEELVKTNEKLAHPCNHDVERPMVVALMQEEWVQVVGVLETMARQINDQGPQEGQTRQDALDAEHKIQTLVFKIRAAGAGLL